MPPRASTYVLTPFPPRKETHSDSDSPCSRASSSAAASKAPAAPPTPPAPPASGPYDVVLNVQDGAKTLTVWLNNDEAVHVSTKPDAEPAVKRERRDLVTSRPHTRHVELTTEGAKTVFTMSTTYGSAERELVDDKAVELDEPARCSSSVAKKRKLDAVAAVERVPVAQKPATDCRSGKSLTLHVRRGGQPYHGGVRRRPHPVCSQAVTNSVLATQVLLRVHPTTSVFKVQQAVADHFGLPVQNQRLEVDRCRLDSYLSIKDALDGYYDLGEDFDEAEPIPLELWPEAVGGKPVIYLFPPSSLSRAQVSLALSPEWTFSALYPVVDINTDVVVDEDKGVGQVKQHVEWTVSAEPDGSLVELSSGLKLSYLFWEATSTGIVTSSTLSSSSSTQQVDLEPSFHPSSPSLDLSNGVVLAFSPFLAHLDAALSSLSLHTSARNDFITFWLPHFTRIRVAGKEILFRFLPQAEYARAAELDVEPKPDVVTRVFLLFKGVEPGSASSSLSSGRSAAEVDWAREVGVDEVKARDESLFRVLEWGGMECV